MADLYVTEYSNLALNGHAPIPQEPAIAQQKVTFTTTTASAAFNERTRFVRIVASADAYVTFATSPTATTSDQFLSAEMEYFRGVPEGKAFKVAAVAAA